MQYVISQIQMKDSEPGKIKELHPFSTWNLLNFYMQPVIGPPREEYIRDHWIKYFYDAVNDTPVAKMYMDHSFYVPMSVDDLENATDAEKNFFRQLQEEIGPVVEEDEYRCDHYDIKFHEGKIWALEIESWVRKYGDDDEEFDEEVDDTEYIDYTTLYFYKRTPAREWVQLEEPYAMIKH